MTPEAPHDPELRRLELRGAPVTYTDDGATGPPLVLIHGLPGSVRDWRWLGSAVRALEPDRRVVRLDLPGFGGTAEALGGAMSLEERAQFVVDVLDALDLRDVVLAGHSMGGPVVLGAAVLASERVARLALLASVGLTPHRAYRAMPRPSVLFPLLSSGVGRRFLERPLRAIFVRGGFPRSTPKDALFVTVRAAGALRFATIRAYADELAGRGLPLDAFVADDDPLVEPAVGRALVDALGGRLHRFETGGHNIQKTRAVELARVFVS